MYQHINSRRSIEIQLGFMVSDSKVMACKDYNAHFKKIILVCSTCDNIMENAGKS